MLTGQGRPISMQTAIVRYGECQREVNKGLSFQAVPGGSLQVNAVVTVHKNRHFIQQKGDGGRGGAWRKMVRHEKFP